MEILELEKVCLAEVLTAEEVHQTYGISRKRIYDLCKAGGLIARQSSTVWLISKSSCEKRWEAKDGRAH